MAAIMPTTFAAGNQSVADFNTYISDIERQLLGHSGNSKPFAVVTASAPVALTSGVFTAIDMDTVTINRGGLWDGSTLTVPTTWAGLYMVTASVDVDASSGNKELRISINGDEGGPAQNIYGVATAAYARLSVSALMWLDEGDTIEAIVFQDSGASVNARAVGSLPQLAACFLATVN